MKAKNVNKILTETQQIYDKIAPSFAITRGKWWKAYQDFDKYAKAGDFILDIGCGNGRMAELFEKKDVKYLGVDNSAELIKIAQERYKENPNINFEVGDATYLNFSQNNFEIVLMIAVLHHIPTRKLRLKILKDINGILKKDGILIMANWNLWQLGYVKKYWSKLLNYPYKIKKGTWSLKDAFIPWKPIGNASQRYVHSFTLGELKGLLAKSGFEIVSAGYENSGEKSNFLKGFNSMVIARKK